MKATDRGGMICVHEPSGQLMGYLAANTETGAVGVHGSHGARACLIGSDANGGVVTSTISTANSSPNCPPPKTRRNPTNPELIEEKRLPLTLAGKNQRRRSWEAALLGSESEHLAGVENLPGASGSRTRSAC